MKRILKIVAGGLGTLLIVGGTISGYLAISPWRLGTTSSSAKGTIAIFLLCAIFPYFLAAGVLGHGEQRLTENEASTPLGSFSVHDENSSNYTRTIAAVAFAVIVMAFCMFFPLLSPRALR